MKCYICDATLDKPQFNRDHDDWDPCPRCQDVITDTLNGFKDQTVFPDDDVAALATIFPTSTISLDNLSKRV